MICKNVQALTVTRPVSSRKTRVSSSSTPTRIYAPSPQVAEALRTLMPPGCASTDLLAWRCGNGSPKIHGCTPSRFLSVTDRMRFGALHARFVENDGSVGYFEPPIRFIRC